MNNQNTTTKKMASIDCDSMSMGELREVGKKYNVKGTSKKILCERIQLASSGRKSRSSSSGKKTVKKVAKRASARKTPTASGKKTPKRASRAKKQREHEEYVEEEEP